MNMRSKHLVLATLLSTLLALSGCSDDDPPGVEPTGSIVFAVYKFDGDNAPETDIWRIRADGSEPNALTSDGAFNGDPAPSPDGKRVAFDKGGVVHVMNADGSSPVALADGRFPDFSPDGSKLIYSDGTGIKVMDLDGENPRTLLERGDMPDWSVDGLIAFRDADNIWVMDDEGGNVRNLTNDELPFAGSPRWSPDGTKIAFEAAQIYVMNADGSDRRRLTESSSEEYLPDWSPDGEWIAFERTLDSEPGIFRSDIWIARTDGSEARAVTTTRDAGSPKWGVEP